MIGVVPAVRAQVRTQFDVHMPMRDGVQLSADIWLPSAPGTYPAILVRTPYLKNWAYPKFNYGKSGTFFASQGYVYVVQDVRGRGDSDGEFNFFFADAHDGYDTIEWIAAQPWSNGKVGMMGGSYLGTVQWMAARERPPHLICIVPRASTGQYFAEVPYQQGAFALEWALTWLNDTSARTEQRANLEGLDMEAVYKHRPLLTSDVALGRRMRLYREFLEHDTLDDYWKRIQFSSEDFRKLSLPTLTITGWFDDDQSGALFYWRNVRQYSGTKDKHFLLIGPWTHGGTGTGGKPKLGEFEFSADSVYDTTMLHLAFFDYYLKNNGAIFQFPAARIYVTGPNKWMDLNEYPPPEVRSRPLYFHSRGKANTLDGDGRLSWEKPGQEPVDTYTYDPRKPVTPHHEEERGSDQRYIEQRDDVLVYTSNTLKDEIEVIGTVSVELFASSDARDTDFTARLLDVYPDGRALQLGPETGIIRARYRNGPEHIALLTPNKTEHYKIELFDIAHTFLAGHQIRVEVSSSYAPAFNPNPNTGNPIATDADWRVARQSIFHSLDRASYISLPTIPSSPLR